MSEVRRRSSAWTDATTPRYVEAGRCRSVDEACEVREGLLNPSRCHRGSLEADLRREDIALLGVGRGATSNGPGGDLFRPTHRTCLSARELRLADDCGLSTRCPLERPTVCELCDEVPLTVLLVDCVGTQPPTVTVPVVVPFSVEHVTWDTAPAGAAMPTSAADGMASAAAVNATVTKRRMNYPLYSFAPDTPDRPSVP